MDGKNIVILQGFKEYFALGFFQGALLKDLNRTGNMAGAAPAASNLAPLDCRLRASSRMDYRSNSWMDGPHVSWGATLPHTRYGMRQTWPMLEPESVAIAKEKDIVRMPIRIRDEAAEGARIRSGVDAVTPLPATGRFHLGRFRYRLPLATLSRCGTTHEPLRVNSDSEQPTMLGYPKTFERLVPQMLRRFGRRMRLCGPLAPPIDRGIQPRSSRRYTVACSDARVKCRVPRNRSSMRRSISKPWSASWLRA